MNEEILNEENILEDTTYDEDDVSLNESSSLEEKLDRVEALLNEEISKREVEKTENELEERQGSELLTVSPSPSVSNPNYDQYIYDLLTDSTIKVEVVNSETIADKQLNDYTVQESLEVGILVILLGIVLFNFIEKYIFRLKK